MIDSINPPPWPDAALEFCIAKTRHNLAALAGFPERTEGGQWVQLNPDLHGWWVGGHWVGLLGLAYAATGDPSLTAAARVSGNRLLPRQPDQDNHDLGFLFELGFVLGYQLTGDARLNSRPCKPPRRSAGVSTRVGNSSRPGARSTLPPNRVAARSWTP